MNQTIEELEIIIKAKVGDALNKIQELTNVVKSTVKNSSDSMDSLSTSSKEMANNIKISIDNAKKTMSQYESNIKQTMNNSKKELNNAQSEIKKFADDIKKIKIHDNGLDFDVNADFSDFDEQYQKAIDEYNSKVVKIPVNLSGTSMQQQQLSSENPSGDSKNDNFQNITNIEKVKQGIKSMASQSASSMSQMKTQMQSYSGSVNETIKQQEYLKSRISDLKYTLSQVDLGIEVGDSLKISAQIEQLENKLRKLEQQGQNTGDTTNNAFNKIKEKIKSIINSINELGNKFKLITSSSKNLSKSFNSTFNKGVKSIKTFALGLLSVRTAFSLVSKAAQSYLSFDNQLNDSIQNSWNVLGSLLAPILEYIASLFSKVTSAIATFVKMLTGIDLVAKANTKALNNQSKAVQNANKQLAGIDDIDTLSSSNNSNNNNNNVNTTITVEDIDISGIKDAIDKIKEMFAEGDYFGIGELIGQKISNALSNIPWGGIQKKARDIGSGIAQFLNGAISGTDWSTVGNTIAQSLNTALDFAYSFLTTFDFKKFGTSLGTGFFTAVHNINWSELAGIITEGISGFFNTISSFLETVDWGKVATDIATFVKTIDYSKIAKAIFEAIGAALGASVKVLWTWIDDAISSIKEYFTTKITEAGGNVGLGLLKGIADAIKGIATWIVDNIFKPFIDGFKKAFGINSPSTVMIEMGGYIISGLKEGLLNIWDSIKSIFEKLKTNIKNAFTNIKTTISNVMNSVKSTLSNIWNGIWKTIKGVINNIINGIEKMCNTIIRGLNKILEPLTKVGNTILSAVGIKSFSFSTISEVSLPRLKTGNVATEPTLGIFGEYANASTDPEITAPQSAIEQSMINALRAYGFENDNDTHITVQFGVKNVVDEIINEINERVTRRGVTIFKEA